MCEENVMYIIVNPSLNLPVGKLASQVAHAAVLAFAGSNEKNLMLWAKIGQKKIVLKPLDMDAYNTLKNTLSSHHMKYFVVIDSGRTVVTPNTETCYGVEVGNHDYLYERIFKGIPLL